MTNGCTNVVNLKFRETVNGNFLSKGKGTALLEP